LEPNHISAIRITVGKKGALKILLALFRRYYPKGADWENISQRDLNKVSRFINNRSMKLLGFKTPYQVFVALAPLIRVLILPISQGFKKRYNLS
jgi:hypothetical protein